MTEFERDLAAVLNRHNAENESNTADFILAEYLRGCLDVWNQATRRREQWYGVAHVPGGSAAAPPESGAGSLTGHP